MFRLLRAIGRLFRNIVSGITGRTSEAAEGALQNPHAIRDRYEEVISEQQNSIHQMERSFTGLTGIRSRDQGELEELIKKVQRHRKMANGSKNLAGKRVAELKAQGKAAEEIQNDPDYLKFRGAYADHTSTAQSLQTEADQKEGNIAKLDTDLDQLERDILARGRQIKELGAEKERAVADIERAKTMMEESRRVRGVAKSRSSRDLEELRRIRREAVAGQEVARRLSGVDVERQEAELEEAAKDAEFGDELDALLLGAEEAEAPATATEGPERVPEA